MEKDNLVVIIVAIVAIVGIAALVVSSGRSSAPVSLGMNGATGEAASTAKCFQNAAQQGTSCSTCNFYSGNTVMQCDMCVHNFAPGKPIYATGCYTTAT